MKRLLLAAVCFSSFLFLFLLTVTEAQKSAPTPQVLRVICLPTRPLALTVAHDQGLLTKYAVDVHGQVASNSDELRTGLALGKFDLAHAAVDNAVAMNEKSGADVIVVLGGEGSTNELLAHPPPLPSLRQSPSRPHRHPRPPPPRLPHPVKENSPPPRPRPGPRLPDQAYRRSPRPPRRDARTQRVRRFYPRPAHFPPRQT